MPRKPKQSEKPKRRPAGMGSVVVRKGSGRVSVYLPNDLDPKRQATYGPGKRQRFTSASEAGAWLDAEIERRRNPTARSASLSEPLGVYLDRWYRIYSPSMPGRTAVGYAQALQKFELIADVPLGELTHEVIQGAVAYLQTTTWRRKKKYKDGRIAEHGPAYPYSPSTIKRICATLQVALERLVPHILTYNPSRNARLGRGQPAAQPVWDAGQVDLFLSTAERMRSDLALAFRLILRRALRRGEVLALLWTDIDERRRLLLVDDTAGERVGETGDTKGRRIREIPLSDDLLTACRSHRLRQRRFSDWVFPGHKKGKPLSIRRINSIVHEISDAAGLPRITPKDMRATAATILLDENVALARVSRLLGHSNIAITGRFYDRVLMNRPDRVARLSDEFDEAFERASEAAKGTSPAPIAVPKVSGKVSRRKATR